MDKRKKKQGKADEITRKEALQKIGDYGKYAALTALGTYMILHPKTAQAASLHGEPPPPPNGVRFG